MDEEKMGTVGTENASMPAGEAMPVAGMDAQPAPMPTPTPMEQPAEPIVSTAMPQQSAPMPMSAPQPTAPQVERMEMPMQPIDLPGQSEMSAQQMLTPEGDGGKKKMIIITIVVIAGLAAGLIGFFVWRSMNTPVEEAPVVEQVETIPTLPTATEQVVVPSAPEIDDVAAIEQQLNTLNAASMDAELQNGLNAINAAL